MTVVKDRIERFVTVQKTRIPSLNSNGKNKNNHQNSLKNVSCILAKLAIYPITRFERVHKLVSTRVAIAGLNVGLQD